MPQAIGPETKYPRWRLLCPTVALMAILVIASVFARKPPAAPDIFQFDKIAHFFVFGLMGTLNFRCLRIDFLDRRRWLLAFAGVMAFGVLDEILQWLNPNRTFDPFDWLADATGSILAIAAYRNWFWYRSVLESRLWGSTCQIRNP